MIETIYESDERDVPNNRSVRYLIRVEPEVLTFTTVDGRTNVPKTGPPTVPVHVHATANRDAGSLRPRGVMIQWTGAPPSGYQPGGKIYVVVLQLSRFSEYKITDTGTYRGSGFVIVGKRPEVIEG